MIGYHKKPVKVSVVVPNHGRDLTTLKASLPIKTELIEVNRGLERSVQRNIGIQQASGDAFLILDSDQSISPNLIPECVDLINMGYSSVYIPEVLVVKSFFGKIRKFEREFYTGTAVDVPRFVRRDCCPLFDETLTGPEDADWGNRIPGLRAVSKNVLYHHDDIGCIEYFKKKMYYSKSMEDFKRKNPNDRVLNIRYRCWSVFTDNGKWKKLVRHPLLTMGIIIIIFIRGIIYVTNR
jgi:glycosyltransferase involved in cell wall biosynthesis